MAFTGSTVLPFATDNFGAVAGQGYYMVANAQTGTATAAAPTAFSDTNPFVAIFNKNALGSGGASIWLDYIKIIATAPGTAGTALLAATQLDLNGDRYSSGGSDLTANIVNVHGLNSVSSITKYRVGNITATAKSSLARQMSGNMLLLPAIPVANDTIVIKFGGNEQRVEITKQVNTFTYHNHPKVVIPPAGSFLLHFWLPSQSGASSYIAEAGWVEQ